MIAEDALNKLGGFGKWQIMHFTMLGLAVMVPSAFHALAIVYIGYKPQHRCRINENSTLNESIPYEGDQLSSCKMFVNYSLGNETTDCLNGWEYLGDDGPTIVTEWNLVCDREVLTQTSQIAFVFGIMVGAVIFTGLSDKYGRRPVFLISQVMLAIVGLTTSFVENLYLFYFLRFLAGTLQEGVLLPGFILMCELFPTKYRTFVGIMVELFWSFAMCLYPLLAYLISNWRFLQFFISIIGLLLTLPLFRCLPESVTWLYANNKTEKAVSILKEVIKMNKIPQHENMIFLNPNISENKEMRQSTNYSFLDFFRHKRLFLHLVICSSLWFVVSMVYYGLTLSTAQLAGDRFWNGFLNGLVEFPANFILYFIVARCGRKWPLIGWWLVAGIPLLVSPFVPDRAASGMDLSVLKVVLTMVGKFGITCVFSVLVMYGAELFPTNLRAQATGINSFFGRIGNFIASFASLIMEKYPFLMLTTLGLLSFVSAVLVLFLPETHNRPLPETIDEIGFCPETNKKRSDLI